MRKLIYIQDELNQALERESKKSNKTMSRIIQEALIKELGVKVYKKPAKRLRFKQLSMLDM